LRNEIAQEKRENAAFVRNLERSKMIENMKRKKIERGEDGKDTKMRRQFIQKAVVNGSGTEKSSVLSKVFE
jgi:hypothetical protein